MEIDITEFVNSAHPRMYSASIAELGKDAGRITWTNALAQRPHMLTTPEQLTAVVDYVYDFGAWDKDEIAAWTADEINALFVQLVSGDMREGGLDVRPVDWLAYNALVDAGRAGGRLYKGDDGRIYYDLS